MGSRFGAHLAVLGTFLAGSAVRAQEPRLPLVWVDPGNLAPHAYPEIVSESGRALRDMGARLDWQLGRRGDVVGPETLAVIAVRTHGGTPGAGRHVMGATPPGPERPPAVWVYPDQVAWALGLDLSRRPYWNKLMRAAFERALGRVVSHEVAHALGAREHTTGGLMAATLGRRALLAPSLRLDQVSAAVLRTALAEGVRLAQGPPARERALLTPPFRLSPDALSGPARDSGR